MSVVNCYAVLWLMYTPLKYFLLSYIDDFYFLQRNAFKLFLNYLVFNQACTGAPMDSTKVKSNLFPHVEYYLHILMLAAPMFSNDFFLFNVHSRELTLFFFWDIFSQSIMCAQFCHRRIVVLS